MNKRYHFIGIGGIGMSALASLMMEQGYQVTGSDLRSNAVIENLIDRGAIIYLGHDAQNVEGADYAVYSSAIRTDNPEYVQAIRDRIPLIQRARLLALLMEGHIGITVAGAHGKTTTTSMIDHLLVAAEFHPTTAIGGIVHETHSNSRLGRGEYFVTEVDESDGSFLYFSPDYSVITNIDLEHVDQYPGWNDILMAYRKFIGRTKDGGCLFAYGDDKYITRLLIESGKTYRTYGFSTANDIYAKEIVFDQFTTRFRCICDGEDLGHISLNVTGRHNVANALAAIGLGLRFSIGFEKIRAILATYRGVERRFQLKGKVEDIRVIDDYAHHPTEIRAVLATARQFMGTLPDVGGRLIAVFQPHRYTRVRAFFNAFAESLAACDLLVITDIYAASEEPIEGVSAQKLCEQVRLSTNNPVFQIPKDQVTEFLMSTVKPQDVVLTLGAGDITAVADQMVMALNRRYKTVEETL